VALSGESADEVFGGYSWFHDPKAINAATFPWLATTGNTYDGTQVLDPDLLERLNLPEFQADSNAQAIAETPVRKGEDAVERRMREISYLHLTRFVQFLLDRKDRMSMAVGLEVRNTPPDEPRRQVSENVREEVQTLFDNVEQQP
jgi:asparagine synthase (glutamine-hydrolysing)